MRLRSFDVLTYMYFTSQKSTWSWVSCNSHCAISFMSVVIWESCLYQHFYYWSCFNTIEVWTWINSRSTSKIVTAFQAVCQITWHVSSITFHWCKLQSVLSQYVFTAQISYDPSTLHVCQNLYRTSAFSFVNQKSITLFD